MKQKSRLSIHVKGNKKYLTINKNKYKLSNISTIEKEIHGGALMIRDNRGNRIFMNSLIRSERERIIELFAKFGITDKPKDKRSRDSKSFVYTIKNDIYKRSVLKYVSLLFLLLLSSAIIVSLLGLSEIFNIVLIVLFFLFIYYLIKTNYDGISINSERIRLESNAFPVDYSWDEVKEMSFENKKKRMVITLNDNKEKRVKFQNEKLSADDDIHYIKYNDSSISTNLPGTN